MSMSPPERSAMAFLPTNKVVTFVELQTAVDAMTTDLIEVGFDAEDIYVHHGEQGMQYVDPDGSRHGFLSKLIRNYQRLSGMEARILRDAEAALEAGEYLIGVQTDGGEVEQTKARDALAPHTKRSIYFIGRFTITLLRS